MFNYNQVISDPIHPLLVAKLLSEYKQGLVDKNKLHNRRSYAKRTKDFYKVAVISAVLLCIEMEGINSEEA